MKTFNTLLTSIACSTLIGFGSLNSSALAQEKGGERLMKLTSVTHNTDARMAGAAHPMSMCPKCKDVLATVSQPPGKGGRIEKATVLQHQCKSCKTKIETVGVGKQAAVSVKHVCKEKGTANSCAPEQNGSR